MAKMILDISAMQEDFFADAAMIGIVTALPGYHLCWLLNRHFDIDLVREPDQDIPLQKKDNRFLFPVYQYNLPDSSYQYLVYKLKNGNEALLPEAKQFDYIWLIRTADPETDAAVLADGLKRIDGIQLTRVLIPGEMKHLANLLV